MNIFDHCNFYRNALNRDVLLEGGGVKIHRATESIMIRMSSNMLTSNIGVNNTRIVRSRSKENLIKFTRCSLLNAFNVRNSYTSCPNKIIFRLIYADDDFHQHATQSSWD